MKIRSGKLFAAAAVCVLMTVLFTGCNNGKDKDKAKYEALRNDIVGVWCDINGPEYLIDGEDYYFRLYEFTPDGGLYYHIPKNGLDIYYDASYTLTDDLLNVDGGLCRISIENDILTMNYDSGASEYRRMDIPEICEYNVWCVNNDLYNQQLAYVYGEPEEEIPAE